MQLSVIILNYNVRWFLQQCLYSVREAVKGMDAEVIVVDNASPDDSVSMIKTEFPDVILIENKENSGFPKGNNIGVAAAKGEFICILNPDTVVGEETFRNAIGYYRQQQNPGIVGVKLLDGRGNFLPESKRGIPTPLVAFSRVSGLYRLSPKWFGKYYAQHLGQHESGEVEILVGAFMLMKRQHYLDIGGFDENCFMYSDDIDLSYMMLKSGRDNHYFGGETVIHYKGESTVRDARYMRRFRDAMDFFYRKHFRRSVAFDLFMRAGSFAFLLARVAKPMPISVVDAYRFDGAPEIANKIAQATGKPVSNRAVAHVAHVLEPMRTGFAHMIATMEDNTNRAEAFRAVYPDAGFMIGSDSSQGRGEVTMLGRRQSLPLV